MGEETDRATLHAIVDDVYARHLDDRARTYTTAAAHNDAAAERLQADCDLASKKLFAAITQMVAADATEPAS